ncbi:hypothetical protein [Euzebya tangerina]|uniref:hypothetical protein n=1 Tax=Euzebya tangerina TaxID=591198 RepID=UPI000E31B9D2|nr:hypothetical protein [Euzebya tangerina]
MGIEIYPSGRMNIDPPLNAQERAYLTRINRHSDKIRRPGLSCPWETDPDGRTLAVTMEFGTKEPIPEWLSYLHTHLLGPSGPERFGRALSDFTYNHTITGTVEVEGRSANDRWNLIATGGDGIVVERTRMPCPACWEQLLMGTRPTVAYRFAHPDRRANLVDGGPWFLQPDEWEGHCQSEPFTPVGPTRRKVEWPLPRMMWSAWWIDTELFPDARPFDWNSDPNPWNTDLVLH